MSTAPPILHPLVERLRETLRGDDFLTNAQAAAEIGVSTRTLTYWLNTDTTPQKRYRKQLADWLAERSREDVRA